MLVTQHNAPLHLFSASPQLVDFARGAYRQHSPWTSRVLEQLFESFQREGQLMPYTVEDFERDYIKKHFAKLTPQEQEEALQALPPEKQRQLLQALPPEQRLAGLSAEQIRQYLEQLTAHGPAKPPKPRSKKRPKDSGPP